MPSRSFLRLTALFGVLFAVLSIAGVILQSSGSDLATIVRPTHDEAVRMASTSTPAVVWLGLGLGVAAMGMFVAFAAGLAIVLHRDEDPVANWIARMAFGGALVYVALTVVSFACWAVLDERGAHGLDAQGAIVLADLKSVVFFLSWPALALFLGSTGALVRRTGVLPAWLGWAALGLAVTLLGAVVVPTADVAQTVAALPFLWSVAVAVALLRGRPAVSPTRAAAMMRA